MKAVITDTKFNKEFESKFGTMYSHRVEYNGKVAYYTSKKKDQDYFVKGQEAEFTEEIKTSNKGEYTIIKPIRKGNFSGFSKQLMKEQSKYSGFGVSYVKDLIIAGKIEIKDWEKASEKIIKFMVKMDKRIENGEFNKTESK